jgi:dipeptidyl aminopeptidase/acylaminoacyl peptidase
LLILLALFSCTKKPTDEPIEIEPTPKSAIDKYPSWSPDGKTIVYYHRQESIADSSDTSGLYFINPDGTNKRLFLPGTGFITRPTWSPDSKKLIFSYNYDLFKIDIETKEITQLTFDGAWNLFPDWSPDGEWIAYDSQLGTNGPSW